MKNSLMIGAVIGVITATAIYTSTNKKNSKNTKKAILNKLEDMIM